MDMFRLSQAQPSPRLVLEYAFITGFVTRVPRRMSVFIPVLVGSCNSVFRFFPSFFQPFILLDFQLPMQSVLITTDVVSSNPEMRSIQHYVIKFVNDLRQIGGILCVLRFPPPIKLTTTI